MSVGHSRPDQHEMDDWEPDGSPLNEYISEIIRFPGYWPIDPGCEEITATGFCENGHVQTGAESPCKTRSCPVHWHQWRKDWVESAVARLAAYRYAQGGPRDRGRRMVHTVVAPEQERRWTIEEFWRERSESYGKLEDVGARAGVQVAHPYRASPAGDDTFSTAVQYGDWEPERGKWRLLRELTDDWDSMKPLTAVAPHYHGLTAVEDLDGEAVEEIAEETGGVVHNIRSLAPLYVDREEVPAWALLDENNKIVRTREEAVREGFEDMARLAMYLLSHAAVQPETGDLSMRQTTTWWGELANFDPAEELDEKVWARIQHRAAEAVGAERPEDEGEGIPGRECQQDDCEAVVHELGHLIEKIGGPDGPAWIESLPVEQAWEMWGLKVWLQDRPPPGIEPPDARKIEYVDGQGQFIESGLTPGGGFERSAEGAAGPITSAEDFREWLRSLGRSRIDQNPWYRVPTEA